MQFPQSSNTSNSHKNGVFTPFYFVFGVRRVNKYKLLICASTNAIYTFDTYIISWLNYKYYHGQKCCHLWTYIIAWIYIAPTGTDTKMQMGTVEYPVDPTLAIVCPFFTFCPLLARSWEQCMYTVLTPPPWSIMI